MSSLTTTNFINTLVLSIAGTLLYTPIHHHHASAQPTTPTPPSPIPVSSIAYATTHDQRTFYVQGEASQLFSLDLTQPSWNTSFPPWKPLAIRAVSSSYSLVGNGLAMAISKDDTQVLEWDPQIGFATYDVRKDTWNETSITNGTRTGDFGYTAATDPDTGLVYIPSGTNDMSGMLVYDFVSKTSSSAPMPPTELLTMSVGKYVWAWNGVRQSMLLHGGGNYANLSNLYGNPNLFEFIPSTVQWSLLPTEGQAPPALKEHCMVSALGGSKMVLYGGTLIDTNNTLQGDIYILDIATLTWTKGPVPSSSQRRRNMACTVAGNNFVVWGGQSLSGEFMNTTVYDLQSNQWTTQFSLSSPPSFVMQAATSDKSSITRADTDRGRTIGIIVGVTASVAFLIIVGCIWYCLRRSKGQGIPQWSRVKNVNANNKPKRASKRWSGPAFRNPRNSQESSNLQHQIFEQERRSQEKTMSRSISEKSVSEQLLSPTTTDNSDTIVALNSNGDAIQTQEDWLRVQREEVNREREALAIMQMQQLEYARQMKTLKDEVIIQR